MLFYPALFKFFLGDDWFHLNIIQISSLKEFLNFFSPIPNPQSTAFYRPIPNQLFFYVFYQLFGLNSFFYHLFIFILSGFALYLFYYFLIGLKLSKRTALIALIIVAFSHTNFSRLYFLSAAQETMMSLFILLGLIINQKIKFKKKNIFIALFYLLALLCKDNAVIFPALIIIFDFLKDKKIYFKKIFILSMVAVAYLIIRVFVFGFSATLDGHQSYVPIFSLKTLLNTLYMYSIWAIGGAELLQDYLRTPISLLARYFTDFGFLGKLMISSLISMGTIMLLFFVKNIKKFSKLQVASLLIFFIGLSPVIFFPNHKFSFQMLISMYGFAIFFGILLKDESKKLLSLFLGLYIFLNIISIVMTQNGHYSVQRAEISKSVYDHMMSYYASLTNGTNIVFLNAETRGSEISTWGSSKQVSNALMGENFFETIYPNVQINVFYEDLDEIFDLDDTKTIYLSSDLFIK